MIKSNITQIENLGNADFQYMAGVKEFFANSYFPTLFPSQQTYSLTVNAVLNENQIKNTANMVPFGTSVKSSPRQDVNIMSVQLGKIACRKDLRENEILELRKNQMLAQNNQGFQMILDSIYNDSRECQENVINRHEANCLQLVSNGGTLKFTATNNDASVSEYDIDLGVTNAQKKGYSSTGYCGYAWSNTTNAKPFNDLQKGYEDCKKLGFKPRFVLMSQATFLEMCATEQVAKSINGYVATSLGISEPANIDSVNAYLKRNTALGGLQIVVIDQDMSINGQSLDNPFNAHVCVFVPNIELGKSKWCEPAEYSAQTPALKAMNDFICTSRWGEINPILESTMATAIIFPVWTSYKQALFLDTKNSNWNKGA